MDVDVKLKPKTEDISFNNNLQGQKKDDSELNFKKFDMLGLIVTELSENVKKQNEVEYGVVVKDVAHFSEAFNRGLRSGFVIIEADKKKITSIADLENILNSKNKGDVLVLKVVTQMKDIRLVAIEIQ